jgi:serine/threonine protein kinase
MQFFQSNLDHIMVKVSRTIESIDCRPIEQVGKISICSPFINDYIIGSILGSNSNYSDFFITYYAGIFCNNTPYIFMERLDGPVKNHKEILPRDNPYDEAIDLGCIIFQTTYALIQAYYDKGFEHNDIHTGNIMIKKTNNPQTSYVLNGEHYELPNRGFHVVIIDFGFSKIKINDNIIIQSEHFEHSANISAYNIMYTALKNSVVHEYWKSNYMPNAFENQLKYHNNMKMPKSHEILLAQSYDFIQSITY